MGVKGTDLTSERKIKNINKLMEYARTMKMENKVRSQIEVLLNVN